LDTIQDLYALLGVIPSANDYDIRVAYRKLAVRLHPDKNPGNKDAERRFKEASQAYSILSDADNRRKYDGARQAFRAFGSAPRPTGSAAHEPPSYTYPVADVHVEIELARSEFENGCLKSVSVSRRQTCPDCKGGGRVSGQIQTCNVCDGAGCSYCGGVGRREATTCNRCWGTGSDKAQTRLVVSIPPRTKVTPGRQRFLASGILWERWSGMFYVDAVTRLRGA
jgi:molecular chaperone DnaJ